VSRGFSTTDELLVLLATRAPASVISNTMGQGSTIAIHCLSAWLTATLRNCIVCRIL